MAFYFIPFFSPFAKSIFSWHSGDGIHFLQQAAQAQWMLHKFTGKQSLKRLTAAHCCFIQASPLGDLQNKSKACFTRSSTYCHPQPGWQYLPLNPCQLWDYTTVKRFLCIGQEGDKTLILQTLQRFLVHSPALDLYSVFPGFGHSILCATIATDAHISASRWQFQEGGLKMSV